MLAHRPSLTAIALVFALALGLAGAAAAQWSPVGDLGFPDHPGFFTVLDGDLYIGTYLGNVFRSDDHGQSWVEVAAGLEHATSTVSVARRGDALFASRSGWGGAYRSLLVAGSWQAWQPVPGHPDEMRDITVVGERLLALDAGEIVLSDDGGESFVPATQPAPGVIARSLFAAQGALFAAVAGVGDPYSLHRSSDAGATWQDVTGTLPVFYDLNHTVFGGALYLSLYQSGAQGQLVRTTDLGDSWETIAGPPNDYYCSALAAGDGWLAAGCGGTDPDGQTIYLSRDAATWEPYNGDLPAVHAPVSDLCIHEGYLFHRNTISYRAPLPTFTATPPPPAGASLTNFPDPFNPRTTIALDLPRDLTVRIAVYGLDGRLLRELAAGAMAAGRHTFAWDGRDRAGRALPSGRYHCRVTGAGLVLSEPLLLLR